MGHDHERAAPRGEMAGEPADGLEVEVVRRLVEQQQLGPVEEQLRERDAAALTTRERPDDRVEAAGEARQLDAAERALEHLADPAVARPLVIGKTADHLLPDRPRRIEGVELAEQADAQIRRPRHPPCIGLVETCDQREERRLAGAVRSDDADPLAGGDPERDIGEDGVSTEALPQALDAHELSRCCHRHALSANASG